MRPLLSRHRLLPVAVFLAASFFARDARCGDAIPRPAQPNIPDKVFNIADHGAIGDGKTLATSAIQKTIDACSAAGGGTVLVPAGDYLTGPFVLASCMRFEIAKDATIRIDNRISSYPKNAKGFVNCITADKAHDMEICGPGKIDGQGAPWWAAFLADKTGFPHRPCLIVLTDCTRVLVKQISLVNSPSFHLVTAHCADVTIDGVSATAPENSPNTDAIDPSGWNYFITNCTLDVGDDDIAVKPSGPVDASKSSCGNITITDCAFLHGHGVSIGGQTEGGLHGMWVRNCTFKDTTNGIRMKGSREAGGVVEDLHYDHITMTNVKNPILITSYYPKAPKNPADDPAQPANTRGPAWRDITISNLAAAGSQSAGTIWGVPELPVANITFNAVKISAGAGIKIYNARGISFLNSNISTAKGDKLMLYNAQVTGL